MTVKSRTEDARKQACKCTFNWLPEIHQKTKKETTKDMATDISEDLEEPGDGQNE